jgi:hypothetical protein
MSESLTSDSLGDGSSWLQTCEPSAAKAIFSAHAIAIVVSFTLG